MGKHTLVMARLAFVFGGCGCSATTGREANTANCNARANSN